MELQAVLAFTEATSTTQDDAAEATNVEKHAAPAAAQAELALINERSSIN